MRLFISLGESSVNELKFERGPIYVGRQMGSQVFLPDKSVSRQHSVFYTSKDGTWIVEDLGSSNKTYLNSQIVHKAELKHNDVVRIADFLIRVSLEADEEQDRLLKKPEDTAVGEGHVHRDLHTVERNLDSHDAPPIKFPAKQISLYHIFIKEICTKSTLDSLFKSTMSILFNQFSAKNIWMCVRKNPSGPMDIEDGRKITTEHISRTDLAVPASLSEAMTQNKYLLIHQLPRQITSCGIRSVMIAPIIANDNNHGVIYLSNSTEHPHYNINDLDYLILLTINVGYLIESL